MRAGVPAQGPRAPQQPLHRRRPRCGHRRHPSPHPPLAGSSERPLVGCARLDSLAVSIPEACAQRSVLRDVDRGPGHRRSRRPSRHGRRSGWRSGRRTRVGGSPPGNESRPSIGWIEGIASETFPMSVGAGEALRHAGRGREARGRAPGRSCGSAPPCSRSCATSRVGEVPRWRARGGRRSRARRLRSSASPSARTLVRSAIAAGADDVARARVRRHDVRGLAAAQHDAVDAIGLADVLAQKTDRRLRDRQARLRR